MPGLLPEVTKCHHAELAKFLMWRQVRWCVLHCISQRLHNGGSGFQKTKVREKNNLKKVLAIELVYNFFTASLGGGQKGEGKIILE